ncbi:MAG: NUDIX domain-containing protein [Acidobacteriota bacterium]
MIHVSIMLLTLPDGRIVFQRRDGNTHISPHLLGFFGGHVEEGETYDEAMVREMGEETSLDIDSLKWEFVQDFTVSPNTENPATFHLYWAEIPDIKFEVFEGVRAEVYTREEALARDDVARAPMYVLTKILKEK